MKKIILFFGCLLSLSSNAQLGRAAVDALWAPRVVPITAQRQQTWLSFYNTVDNPSTGTGSIVMSSGASITTLTATKYVKSGGTSSQYLMADGSVNSSITSLGTVTTGVWSGTPVSDSYISSASTWSAKQAALVSGTNIKTVNSTSLLGSGDIVISGGGYAPASFPAAQVGYGNLYSTGNLTSDPALVFVKDTSLQTQPGEYQSYLNIMGNERGAGYSHLVSVSVIDDNTNNYGSLYYDALDNYAFIETSLTTPFILNPQNAANGNVITTTSVGLSIGGWSGWGSAVNILPSAEIDLAGGTTTRGQIRLRTGTALATVVAGSHEYTSTQGHMLTDANGRYRTVGTTSAATVGNNQIIVGLTNNRIQSYSNAQYDGTNMSLPHYSGTGATLTKTMGSGSGTAGTGTVSAGSDDFSGAISITTDASGVTAAAVIITVTFNTAFSTAPTVILTPGNAATALLDGTTGVYINTTTTAFTINAGSAALANSTIYKWFYMAAQN